MNLEYMRSAVLQNFSAAADLPVEDIVVHGSEDQDFDGARANLLIYSGEWQNLSVLYLNTIIMRPKTTLQVITYSVTATFSDSHRKTHSDFLSMVKFK